MRGPPAAAPRFDTLPEMLEVAALDDSGLVFVDRQERDEPLPWREVQARARRVAGALIAKGVRRGDRVAIVLPTSPGFVDTFFGTLLARAIPVPLYPPLRLGRMDEYHRSTARMLSLVQARAVVADERIRLLLGQAVAQARPSLGVLTAPSLLEAGESPCELGANADDLALIQFSSGSTVDPKPVCLTHRNVLSQLAALKALLPVADSERRVGVSWLPLYHDMGLIGALLFAAYYPGTAVLIPPELFLARPSMWLRTLSRFRAVLSGAPSFAYALCAQRIPESELAGVDLSSWKYALNGAEPVSPQAMQAFVERFSPFGFQPESLMPVYGLSEAALAVTFTPRRHPTRVLPIDARALASRSEVEPGSRPLVSVGTPIPGIELEVRSAEGISLGDRRVGRIFARGASVMVGYHQDPGATANALVDGWLDTGDLGFLAEGELYVCGRAKDVVIIRGANHSPHEFEECLEGLEGLRPGCAVAVGFTPDGGEEGLLVLAETLGGPSPKLEDGIRARILECTGVRAQSVQPLPPGTLPRTSSGKMRRGEALRRYLAGELNPPNKVNAAQLVRELARSAVGYARAKG